MSAFVDSNTKEIYYSLSKSDGSFTAEYSLDGENFILTRMFEMLKAIGSCNIGVYASSLFESSFATKFTDFTFEV